MKKWINPYASKPIYIMSDTSSPLFHEVMEWVKSG